MIHPVKDSAERGIVFSKYRFLKILFGIPNKFLKNKKNRSVTSGIMLHLILQNDYNKIL